jgi:anti-anti-sigma factor
MANEVEATLRDAPPLTVIDLRGEVTTFADEAINSAYRQACEQGAENILMNFADVDYLNSAGISIIIGVLTEARKADQRLLVTGLTPHYQKIFQMMGLSQYAPVFESEAAARQSIAAG